MNRQKACSLCYVLFIFSPPVNLSIIEDFNFPEFFRTKLILHKFPMRQKPGKNGLLCTCGNFDQQRTGAI